MLIERDPETGNFQGYRTSNARDTRDSTRHQVLSVVILVGILREDLVNRQSRDHQAASYRVLRYTSDRPDTR